MAMRLDKARFQRIFLLLGLSSFMVYGTFLVGVLAYFRGELRHQSIHSHGHLLAQFSQYLFEQVPDLLPLDVELLAVAAEASAMDGVVALRLHQPPDRWAASLPDNVIPARMSEADARLLARGLPVTRFHKAIAEAALFNDPEAIEAYGTFPLVEAIVPVRSADGNVVAAIQYWLDGNDAAEALAQLDRSLRRIGGIVLSGGTLLYILLFIAARRRLITLGRLLAERNASLEQANRELAVMARTAAIGSVTANLFHGLKNPLASLKAYLRLTGEDPEAVALANRMQALVQETLAVIQESNSNLPVRIELAEFAELIRQRLATSVVAAGQELRVGCHAHGELSSLSAQLLLLILRNLVDNAVDASASGSTILIEIHHGDGGPAAQNLQIRVIDHGSGIARDLQDQLFIPKTSHKPQGSGLGLAICAALARQIPAQLSLEKSDSAGTTFLLQLSLK